jgi:hypothetical protein
MGKICRLPGFIFLVAMWMLTAQAGNVTGKWTGIIEINDTGGDAKHQTPVELHLEQKDGALSGKIGRENDPGPVEIRNARIEGDRVTFEASSDETSTPMKFLLTIRGERMQGEMKGAAHGAEIAAKVSFSRVK